MISEISVNPASSIIVWFRKDLRLRDHPGLHAAMLTGEKIIPVFIWDSEEGGHWSPGASSRWWLHHALQSLAKEINGLGGQLILKKGKAAEILPLLAQENNAGKVFYSRTYDPYSIATQESVGRSLDDARIETESFILPLCRNPGK